MTFERTCKPRLFSENSLEQNGVRLLHWHLQAGKISRIRVVNLDFVIQTGGNLRSALHLCFTPSVVEPPGRRLFRSVYD